MGEREGGQRPNPQQNPSDVRTRSAYNLDLSLREKETETKTKCQQSEFLKATKPVSGHWAQTIHSSFIALSLASDSVCQQKERDRGASDPHHIPGITGYGELRAKKTQWVKI